MYACCKGIVLCKVVGRFAEKFCKALYCTTSLSENIMQLLGAPIHSLRTLYHPSPWPNCMKVLTMLALSMTGLAELSNYPGLSSPEHSVLSYIRSPATQFHSWFLHLKHPIFKCQLPPMIADYREHDQTLLSLEKRMLEQHGSRCRAAKLWCTRTQWMYIWTACCCIPHFDYWRLASSGG